jgi:hypothetical protein
MTSGRLVDEEVIKRVLGIVARPEPDGGANDGARADGVQRGGVVIQVLDAVRRVFVVLVDEAEIRGQVRDRRNTPLFKFRT